MELLPRTQALTHRPSRPGAHPLVLLAEQQWTAPGAPSRTLGLEELTEWLAGRVSLDYFRIDPLKIDFTAVTAVMSAAYAARYVAKNIVAAGLAARCEVQVSYAIGVAEPTSISVETFGTGKVAEALLVKLVREFFELRPYGLIEMLDLKRPIYQATAAYGHFGRDDLDLPWERLDKVDDLKASV